MALWNPPQPRRPQRGDDTQPLPPLPTPRADLPTRSLPDQRTRLAHVDAALRAGALTADEAQILHDLIRYHPGEFGELDIYRRFSAHPRPDDEWVVWTHDGERPLRWWRAVCRQVMWRDHGRR